MGETHFGPTNASQDRPNSAWLFDIDGVLTEPERKIIQRQELLTEIAALLERGEPVGGNTGRSSQFAEERFLLPLERVLSNKQLLERVIVIGDKGGAWIVHDHEGTRTRHVEGLLPPEQLTRLADHARAMVNERFSDIAFFDETKQTMVTIEMRDGACIADFSAIQGDLVEQLQQLVEDLHLTDLLRIDPTRIAVDVEHIDAGKALGTRRFLKILMERGIHPRRFAAFGDSPSDYDMAEELHRLGHEVEFVFVGGKEYLKGRASGVFPVVFTEGHCDAGTLEYLTSKHESSTHHDCPASW